MRACLWILLWMLASTCLAAESTNIVDVLRGFMLELDRLEKGEILQPGPEAPPTPAPERPSETNPPTATATDQPSETRLAAGDSLKIEIAGEPDMSTNRVVVAKDGTIDLPLAGRVNVARKTLEEATKVVRDYLGADYLVDPQVKLTLLEKVRSVPTPPVTRKPERAEEIWPGVPARSESVKPEAKPPAPVQPPPATKECRFSISNQVRNPGSYAWACERGMNLLRAIGMAGGVTARADWSRVTIRRTVEGKRREFLHDLRALAQEPEAKPPELLHGDEVEVPRE